MLSAVAKYLPFFYLVLIAGAELITTFYDPFWGLVCHALIMFCLYGHAIVLYPAAKKSSFLLMSIALAPLIRILSLYAPLASFTYLHWFIILSLPLFTASVIIIVFQQLNARDVGLVLKSRQIPVQFAICFTGIPFGYIEYLILKPEPLIPELSFQTLIAPVIIMLLCTGLMEELVFRGIIQHNAVTYFNPGIGIFFVALLFAVLHIGNMSLLDVVFVFLVGYFYSYVVQATNTIAGVTISHGVTNIVLFLLLPLLWTV